MQIIVCKPMLLLPILGVCLQVNAAIYASQLLSEAPKNGGTNKEEPIATKTVSNRIVISLNEEFELCKVKNNCLTFFSSVALGKNRNPMQNKKIRQIELVNDVDEMALLIYGTTTGQIKILRGITNVKVVLLTEQKRTSATVWLHSGYNSGAKFKPKRPATKKKLRVFSHHPCKTALHD